MAIYYLDCQIIGRKDGRSAVACAAYRSGQKLQDERYDKIQRFRERLVQPECHILAPDSAPNWAYDREKLWNEVERVEKRYDARLAREFRIAIPKELGKEEQTKLVLDYSQEQFVNRGMIADVCIHRDDVNNPHVHIMLTTRNITPDGFEKKNRDWNKQELLLEWRKEWAFYANRALERAGFEERIDHRSYEERGIDRVPQKHMGSFVHRAEQRAKEEAKKKGEEYKPVTEIGQLNAEIQKLNKEMEQVQGKIISLQAKRQERQKDLRYQLKKIGTWEQLSPVEKASVMYVRKRMKQYADLPAALRCQESLQRWEKSLNKRETELHQSIEDLEAAASFIRDYHEAEKGSIAEDRARIQLARLGFTPERFDETWIQRTSGLQEETGKIQKQKAFVKEGLQKTQVAIQTFERITLEQVKILYPDANQRTLKQLSTGDLWRLVNEFQEKGECVSLSTALHNQQPPANKRIEKPIVQQWDEMSRNQRFLINWKRKLDKREQEVMGIRNGNPNDFAQQMKEITQERRILAERFKHLKTTESVLEKAALAEVQRLHPEFEGLDGKQALKILRLHESAGEDLSSEDIKKIADGEFFSRQHKQREDQMESQIERYAMEQMAREIMQVIQNIQRDPGGKDELSRMTEEQQRRAKKQKYRDRGMGRSL